MSWRNERSWYNDRIFETFITEEKIDKQHDKISIEAFKEVMPWFMKYGAIHYKHTSIVFGEPLAWKVDGDKIKLKVGVHKKFPVHDDIWKEIQEYGERGTASIGGQSIMRDEKCNSKECWTDITKLGLWDVSWVGANPANTGAQVDKVNMLAKERKEPERMRDSLANELFGKPFNELSDEEKQKVHNVAMIAREKETEQKSNNFIQKPFGPWDDFDACVIDMKQHYSEETAKKVCGALKRDLEKEVDKKDMGKEEVKEPDKAPKVNKQEGEEGEEEVVDIKAVLAEIMRRLDKLEAATTGEEETEEETEEEAEEKSDEKSAETKASEKQKEVTVRVKGEELDKQVEAKVEEILEKHKITVKSTEKPTQADGSGSKLSFTDMLEKAKEANNMEEYRNDV